MFCDESVLLAVVLLFYLLEACFIAIAILFPIAYIAVTDFDYKKIRRKKTNE